MADTTAPEKAKRLAIKILEKDFDQLTAWQEKWSKKGVEFALEEVIDYVMQTATVRIEALEKYAKKQKAARKEAASKRPAKPKKEKAPKKEKKARTKKTKPAAETKDEKTPSAAPASESAGEPPEQTGGAVEGAPTVVEDAKKKTKEDADNAEMEKVLAESRAARES